MVSLFGIEHADQDHAQILLRYLAKVLRFLLHIRTDHFLRPELSREVVHAEEKVSLAYAVPKEGSQVWFDLFTIPADAPNPAAAYSFLNFMLKPEVIARASNYTKYANANAASSGLSPSASWPRAMSASACRSRSSRLMPPPHRWTPATVDHACAAARPHRLR